MRAVLVALLSATPAVASAQTEFRGTVVGPLVLRSIDTFESHLALLRAQARNDRALLTFGAMYRWAPGSFVLDDGQVVDGNLARYDFGASVGFGQPSNFAAFAGFNFDGFVVSQGFFGSIGTFGVPHAGQGIAFAGVAAFQLQLTFQLGVSGINPTSLGLDAWGHFRQEEGDDTDVYRAALPFDGDRGLGNSGNFTTWTLYEGRSGAVISLTNGPTVRGTVGPDGYVHFNYGETGIQAVRVQVQPLKQLLPSYFGLPQLGFDLLASGLAGLSAGVATLSTDLEAAPPKILSLGSDDVLDFGVRLKAAIEVSPDFRFDRAELGVVQLPGDGIYEPLDWLGRGALLTLYRRGDGSIGTAIEAFLMVAVLAPMKEEGAKVPIGHLMFAYTYDAPDLTGTFFPIERAHTFGVQLVFGPPESVKPLIPAVRSLAAREAAAPPAMEEAPPPEEEDPFDAPQPKKRPRRGRSEEPPPAPAPPPPEEEDPWLDP